MASEEELFREQEINRLQRERSGIAKETAAALAEQQNVIESQVRNIGFEKTERANILKALREINTISQRNLGISLRDLSNKKLSSKIDADKVRLGQLNASLLKQISTLNLEDEKLQAEIARSISFQVVQSKELAKELSTVQDLTEEIANNSKVQKFRGISGFLKSIPGLRQFAGPFDEAADNIAQAGVEARRLSTEVDGLLDGSVQFSQSKIIELGLEEELAGLQEKEAIARLQQLKTQDKFNAKLNVSKAISKENVKIFNQLGKGAIGSITLKGILAIDTAQAEFNREIGRSANLFDTINTSLISTTDLLRTSVALTEQFGFAATSAFDNETLVSASELVNLSKLTANQAGRFALFSQTTGTNLDDNLDTIVDQVGEINIANKSAVTQRRIFEDIGNTSSAIALTFQGNSVELARAAQNARILGINLQQVDNIASGLLDIESSIAAEFEAEVISGKQLNLERARFFALTNDLDGLTQELANNQEILNKFATGNRVQQEAIAKSLNMSRDEMADMIFQQRVQLGITDEQARLTAGLTRQDFQRLSAQETIAKSIEKIGEVLAIGVAPIFKMIADNAGALLFVLSAIAAVKLGSLAVTLGKIVAGLITASAIGTPAALLVGLSTAALAFGVISALQSQFAQDMASVGDAIIPSTGKPIISTREGGLFQGTANDDVLMGPGLARGRNAGGTVTLSNQQIQQIADAVRDGASRATINLDGDRVSSRLQTPMELNNLPGV